VLLIDDSAFFRNMLAPVLNAAGYDVTTAAGGEEALSLLHRGRRFDVILTDIDMPGISGFEFAEQLHKDPRTAGISVIGLSSMISQELIERGRQAGFHDYVAKFDRQGLVAALKEQTAAAQAA
jgi:two-component system, chemotaxis family, sensor kinase CheA